MLRWRILLGAALIGLLIGLVRIDHVGSMPGFWLFCLTVVVGLLAAGEVVSLYAAGGHQPLPGVIYGGTLLVLLSNAIPLFLWPISDEHPLERLGWPLIAYMLSVMLAWMAEMLRYERPGGSMVQVGLAALGIAYVGLLLTFALQLRLLGGHQSGLVGLAALIIVVKMGDTGAYTIGRLFGRHKMSPKISPGKTIEGAVGAAIFGCLGAWVAFHRLPTLIGFAQHRPDGSWLVFGLIVALAGLVGDLAESLFKRDMGVKDSSTWMPGFGGVLDLIDSIIFAAPVAYPCWLL